MLNAEKARVNMKPNVAHDVAAVKDKAKLDILPTAAIEDKKSLGADLEKRNAVQAEFLHAWQGYKDYAWGFDDLVRKCIVYRSVLKSIDSSIPYRNEVRTVTVWA
jgi:hypothetical protein